MLTPEERNEVMSRVNGKNTKPEVWVRSVLDVLRPYSSGCRKLGFLEVPPSGGHETYKGSVRFLAD
jgi:hypothetical protein